MQNKKEIIEKIEEMRRRLDQLVKEYGVGSPEVLTMSQQLDEALNQYYQLVRRT